MADPRKLSLLKRPAFLVFLTLLACVVAVFFITYFHASQKLRDIVRETDRIRGCAPGYNSKIGPYWKIMVAPAQSSNEYDFIIPLKGDAKILNQFALAELCMDAQTWPLSDNRYAIDLDCISKILGVPKAYISELKDESTSALYLANFNSKLLGLFYEYDDLESMRENLALGQINTVNLKPNTKRGDLEGILVGDVCFVDNVTKPRHIIFVRGNIMVSLTYYQQIERILEHASQVDDCIQAKIVRKDS